MKSRTILLGVLAMSLITSNVFAKPERMEIKKADRRAKEQTAKASIKNINLQNIEDPEARKAIQQIFNYLNLQSQK